MGAEIKRRNDVSGAQKNAPIEKWGAGLAE